MEQACRSGALPEVAGLRHGRDLMKMIIALAAALLATGAVAQDVPPNTNTTNTNTMAEPPPPSDQGSMNMGNTRGMRSGTHHMRRHHHRMMRHHHMTRHHRHTTTTTKKY